MTKKPSRSDFILSIFSPPCTFTKTNLWHGNFHIFTWLKICLKKQNWSLTEEARHQLKKWLSADYRVYEYFRYKFKYISEQFGAEKMKQELQIFNRANDRAKSRCVIDLLKKEELENGQDLFGKGRMGYKLNESDSECYYLALEERHFLDEIRRNMAENLPKQQAHKKK